MEPQPPVAETLLSQKKCRRRQTLVNKPLQLRYMAYIGGTLVVVSSVLIISLYFGIWGGILDAFSDAKIREDLLTASRLNQYDEARSPTSEPGQNTRLLFFKQADRLSERQREVFKEILDETNHQLLRKYILLVLLIAWGTIYISHKIAGPLYRFDSTLDQLYRGNLKIRVNLRRFDETKFLANKFNATIQRFDMTFSKLKNIVHENRSDLNRLVSHLDEELSKIKTSDPDAS